MAAAALAGLGNAPFHPVDFTILNQRVSQRRLGHAFALHGITGTRLGRGTGVFGWLERRVRFVARMVAGGFLVTRADRLEKIHWRLPDRLCAAAGGRRRRALPSVAAAVLTALAGFGIGRVGPSRDMLIKRAAPPGATGRVHGTVYSGLDLGFAVAAPVFGALLDHGASGAIFRGAARR